MPTLLPQDADGLRIQALRYADTYGKHHVAFGAASARNPVAFDPGTRIVSLYAEADCYFNFGDASVAATTADHFLPGGLYIPDVAVGGDKVAQYTHIAVIQASAAGTLHISEKE
jgi:hypothetical protein